MQLLYILNMVLIFFTAKIVENHLLTINQSILPELNHVSIFISTPNDSKYQQFLNWQKEPNIPTGNSFNPISNAYTLSFCVTSWNDFFSPNSYLRFRLERISILLTRVSKLLYFTFINFMKSSSGSYKRCSLHFCRYWPGIGMWFFWFVY